MTTKGEMAEWFKVHAWKVCVLSKVPRVRIPVSPPIIEENIGGKIKILKFSIEVMYKYFIK